VHPRAEKKMGRNLEAVVSAHPGKTRSNFFDEIFSCRRELEDGVVNLAVLATPMSTKE